MTVTWLPAPFPQTPLLDGYSDEEADNLVKNQPDRGPPKTRLLGTTNVEPVTCLWGLISDSQRYTVWKPFWVNDLRYGAIPWDHPVWLDGNPARLQLVAQPKWQRRDQWWVMSTDIVILQTGM